jgi:hypothetical protein
MIDFFFDDLEGSQKNFDRFEGTAKEIENFGSIKFFFVGWPHLIPQIKGFTV